MRHWINIYFWDVIQEEKKSMIISSASTRPHAQKTYSNCNSLVKPWLDEFFLVILTSSALKVFCSWFLKERIIPKLLLEWFFISAPLLSLLISSKGGTWKQKGKSCFVLKRLYIKSTTWILRSWDQKLINLLLSVCPILRDPEDFLLRCPQLPSDETQKSCPASGTGCLQGLSNRCNHSQKAEDIILVLEFRILVRLRLHNPFREVILSVNISHSV